MSNTQKNPTEMAPSATFSAVQIYFNRHSLFVILFLILSLFLGLWSFDYFSFSKGEAPEDEMVIEAIDENYFVGVDFFLTKPASSLLKVNASEASVLDKGNRVVMFHPKGQMISKSGQAFDFQSNRGLLRQEQQYVMLEDQADVTSVNMRLKAKQIEYFANQQKMAAKGEVQSWALDARRKDKIRLFADQMDWFIQRESGEFRGHVDGTLTRSRAFEQGIDFWSDVIKSDLVAGMMWLEGNVKFRKQELTATSRSGDITLENYNKKLKYYTLYDDVKVVEKVKTVEGPLIRRALSERLDGYMAEDKIVLTGSPKVFQQQDTIKGNTIILRPNSEVIEVDDARTNFILR